MTEEMVATAEKKAAITLSQVDTDAQQTLMIAQTLEVDSQEKYTFTAEFVKLAKGRLSAFELERKELVTPLNEYVKGLNDRFKEHTVPLREAITVASSKAVEYKSEQERIAEAERVAAEKKAEQKRLRLQRRAVKAEDKGDDQKSQELLDEADAVAPAEVETQIPDKPAGTSFVTRWHAEVVSVVEIARGIADGSIPSHALKPNMPELNKAARALRDSVKWRGVRFVKTTSMASRG